MKESRVEKDGKVVQVMKPIDKPEWSSLKPVILNGSRAVMQARNYSDMLARLSTSSRKPQAPGRRSAGRRIRSANSRTSRPISNMRSDTNPESSGRDYGNHLVRYRIREVGCLQGTRRT